MKKKIKTIIIILIILFVVILISKKVFSNIQSKTKSLDNATDFINMFEEYTVKKDTVTTYVKSTGEITSFNIKNIELDNYTKITETYINDGDIVNEKQKLFKTNTDGYIAYKYSPMYGMIFKTNDEYEQYKIYDINNIGIEFSVSENDVVKLHVDQTATVKINTLKKEVTGTVTYVSKLPTNGRFTVRVKIDYTDDIKFGYSTSINIKISEKNDCIVIPYDYLYLDEDNKYYVILKDNEEAYYNNFYLEEETEYKTYVEIGDITNNKVEIISGLNDNDIVSRWNYYYD